MTITMKKLPLALATGVCALMLAGCGEAQNSQTYPMSMADAKAKLIGKESSYYAGNQTRSLKVTGPSTNGLSAKMWNDVSWNSTCELQIQKVDDSSTKIVPNCGDSGVSAAGAASLGMLHMEVDAHVRQIITGEPISYDKLRMQQTAAFSTKLPQMQGEALGADLSMKAEQYAQQKADAEPSADWGDSGDSGGDDAADDWGN